MSTTGFLKQNVSSFHVSDLLNQFVPQVLTLRNLEFVVLTVSLIRIFDTVRNLLIENERKLQFET